MRKGFKPKGFGDSRPKKNQRVRNVKGFRDRRIGDSRPKKKQRAKNEKVI